MIIMLFKSVWLLALAIANVQALSGVCYSPWHHDQVNGDVVQKDLQQVKQFFGGVRTYHAQFNNVNVVDAVAQAGGLKVAVGIQMQDKSKIDAEIKAAVEGAKRHPEIVEAIFVGNENLQNGGHGDISAEELAGYINQVKQQVGGTGIKVGTVQRITEWVEAGNAATVANAVDIMGVNIYPFFNTDNNGQTPFQKFQAQYDSVTKKFPGKDLRVAESGWPRGGSPFGGNIPSKENAQEYFDKFKEWSNDKPMPFYFMMFDTKEGSPDYEKFFGLADTTGQMQIQVPQASGNNNIKQNNNDAPVPTTVAPAPTTAAPAPTTAAPAPTTPAPTPAPSTAAPPPTTPAATAATPAPTPNATQPVTAKEACK